MTKWSHDDRTAQERLKRIGADTALRSVRNAEPNWRALEAVPGGLQKPEAGREDPSALVAALKEIHGYCVRYQKTSRVAARVGKLAAAALATSRKHITS